MNKSGAGSLAYPLLWASRTIEERLEGVLVPVGLSLAKLGCLAALVEAGEAVPLSTLAERCACVRSNITQLVDRLEADKLVARVDDPHDRRSVRAELTQEGRNRHAQGLRAIGNVEHEFFSRLTADQTNELLVLLRVLSGGP